MQNESNSTAMSLDQTQFQKIQVMKASILGAEIEAQFLFGYATSVAVPKVPGVYETKYAPSVSLEITVKEGPQMPDTPSVSLDITEGPQMPGIHRQPQLVTLVVDESGSMDSCKRYDNIKMSLILMLEKWESYFIPGDVLCVITFENDAQVLIKPTPVNSLRAPMMRKVIEEYEYRHGGTDIASGMQCAVNTILKYKADNNCSMHALIAFLTDGEDSDLTRNLKHGTESRFVQKVRDMQSNVFVMYVCVGNDADAVLASSLARTFDRSTSCMVGDITGTDDESREKKGLIMGNVLTVLNTWCMHPLKAVVTAVPKVVHHYGEKRALEYEPESVVNGCGIMKNAKSSLSFNGFKGFPCCDDLEVTCELFYGASSIGKETVTIMGWNGTESKNPDCLIAMMNGLMCEVTEEMNVNPSTRTETIDRALAKLQLFEQDITSIGDDVLQTTVRSHSIDIVSKLQTMRIHSNDPGRIARMAAEASNDARNGADSSARTASVQVARNASRCLSA